MIFLVSISFAALGVSIGLWGVLLPDLQAALGLSPGALGFALTASYFATFPALLFGGRLADRWGARAPILGAGVCMALAYVGLTQVDSYGWLIAMMVLYFAGLGAYDIGINAAAIVVEQHTGRRIMAYFHAAFSAAAGLAASAGGLMLWLEVPFRWQYLGIAAVLAGVGGVVGWSKVFAGPPRPTGPVNRSPSSRIPLGIFLLGAIAALDLLSESTLENWSAIYLRGSLGLPAVLGAAGPAIFHFAVLAGRLGSGRVIKRIGRRGLLTGAGLLTAGGVALALATTVPPVILAGLLVAGLAVSGVVPAAFSLAGDLAPDRAGAASSLIGLVGYLGGLVGPVLIGGLADLAGLRIALAVLIVSGLTIAALSLRVAEAGPRPAPARATAERA